jgi:hypothetical protein
MNSQKQKWKNNRLYKTICAGMHPGGGYVALPDGRTTRLGEMQLGDTLPFLYKAGRRGFVSLPGKA